MQTRKTGAKAVRVAFGLSSPLALLGTAIVVSLSFAITCWLNLYVLASLFLSLSASRSWYLDERLRLPFAAAAAASGRSHARPLTGHTPLLVSLSVSQ